MNRDLERIWKRIEAWLEAYAPTIAGFGWPATAREIAETERYLGVELPDDIRESYLRHDGHGSLFGGSPWLDLDDMRRVWDEHKGGSGRRPRWWHSGCIPLSEDEIGAYAVDLAPRPKGKYGQIIDVSRGASERYVVAKDFRTYLARIAADLEAFEYYPCPFPHVLEAKGCYHVTLSRARESLSPDWWQFVLELAVVFGWKPAGIEGDSESPDVSDYCFRSGEIVTESDAIALGQAIEKVVAAFPKRRSKKFESHLHVVRYFNLRGRSSLTKLAKFCKRGSFRITE